MWYGVIFVIWLIGAIIVFCGFKWYEKHGMDFSSDEDWEALTIILSWISVIIYLIVVKLDKK